MQRARTPRPIDTSKLHPELRDSETAIWLTEGEPTREQIARVVAALPGVSTFFVQLVELSEEPR